MKAHESSSMLSNIIPLSKTEKMHAKATSICWSDFKRNVGGKQSKWPLKGERGIVPNFS